MTSLTVDPIRKYEIKGEVCPMLTAIADVAVSTNNLLVTAVTGKVIRVMKWLGRSSTAAVASQYYFKSGSGGSAIITTQVFAGYDTHPLVIIPNYDDMGYCQTTVSQGLYLDVSGTGLTMVVNYIVYTP